MTIVNDEYRDELEAAIGAASVVSEEVAGVDHHLTLLKAVMDTHFCIFTEGFGFLLRQ